LRSPERPQVLHLLTSHRNAMLYPRLSARFQSPVPRHSKPCRNCWRPAGFPNPQSAIAPSERVQLTVGPDVSSRHLASVIDRRTVTRNAQGNRMPSRPLHYAGTAGAKERTYRHAAVVDSIRFAVASECRGLPVQEGHRVDIPLRIRDPPYRRSRTINSRR
jgi:hypothetical protein